MLAGCLTVLLAFVWLSRLWGDPVLVGVLFLAKIVSYGAVLFFVLDMQRTRFYYYENLGLRSVKQVFRDFELPFGEFTEFFPDLARIYTTRAGELSGGERRLVECYVILRSDSQFVLLDEPFSGVMPLHVETLKRLISEEKRRKGILLTDHLYRHVMGVCDRLYVLVDGSARLAETEADFVRYGYLPHL